MYAGEQPFVFDLVLYSLLKLREPPPFFLIRDDKGAFKEWGTWDWRGGSALKSAHFSYRGPGFDSQYPHGG